MGRVAVLAGLAALCLAVVGVCYWMGNRRQPMPAPEPLLVQMMTVVPHTVPDLIETSGTLLSPHTVDVRPQADGVLLSVLIHDGEQVHAGQLLFTIARGRCGPRSRRPEPPWRATRRSPQMWPTPKRATESSPRPARWI